ATLEPDGSATTTPEGASTAVGTTGKAGRGMRDGPQDALRKPMSNGALGAVSTQPRAKARNPGSAAPAGGACRTIASVVPVSAVMSGGIGAPGLISAANSAGG